MAKQQVVNATQWAVNDGKYSPSGKTVGTLAPAMYAVKMSMYGIYLEETPLETDDLIVLGGSPMETVIHNVRTFWGSKPIFDKLGLLHKRGCLLYGVPGCGKSATVQILAQDVIQDDGIVLLAEHASAAEAGLQMVRKVEPNCKVVVVMEDLDTILRDKGQESKLSNLLDGENQVENVVYVATTNFIDKIATRFKNRPSRFDEVLELSMPDQAVRRAYLARKIPADLQTLDMIDTWVAASNGFAISHLRELIVGVIALGRPFGEVLARLRKMANVSEDIVITGKGAQA